MGEGNATLRKILSLVFNDKFHDDGGRSIRLKKIDFSAVEFVDVEIFLKIWLSKSLVITILESLVVDNDGSIKVLSCSSGGFQSERQGGISLVVVNG